MNFNDIVNIRLANQQIIRKDFNTPKDIVHWIGAMQAQDYHMAKWAIGVRLPTSTDKLVEKFIDYGEIIRTHVLRPTWHFVSSEDIYWMLALTAPRVKATMKSRHRQLEINAEVVSKSNSVIEKALLQGKHLTREELIAELEKAKIAIGDNRAAHLLMLAELDGLICSGAPQGKKHTYALLEERVPYKNTFTKDEALAKLAQKYFASHGPATLEDFVWWSGLSVKEARHALEMTKSDFIAEVCNAKTYWLTHAYSISQNEKESVHLLPSFDEFIISYKDRSAILTFEDHRKAVSNNGIFWPIIVINGQITGIWKRNIKKDKILVETEFFKPLPNETKHSIAQKATAFGNFLGKKTEISHNTD